MSVHTDYVREIAVEKNDKKCISGGYDQLLNVIDLSTCQLQRSIQTDACISSVRYPAPNIFSCTQDTTGALILADLRTPRATTIHHHHVRPLSPSQTHLLV